MKKQSDAKQAFSEIEAVPEAPDQRHSKGTGKVVIEGGGPPSAIAAATVLTEHLFTHTDRNVPGISYTVAYRLADVHTGGDIADVYHFDNDSVALSIADISGKGTEAAVHAAMIKYGLRAYSSHGLTPETVMRAMDRFYLENCKFEDTESFASVFFGVVDSSRRVMTYCCAGHEPVLLVPPHRGPQQLLPTAPIIGVFDDQHHLFREAAVHLEPQTLLVVTSDGVTEARNSSGEFFGMQRLMECVHAASNASIKEIVDAIMHGVSEFSGNVWSDDVVILAARVID